MSRSYKFGIRWTVGDVRARGFEMLRLSIASAFQLLGAAARYVVCVNTLSVDEARHRTGSLPASVEWRRVTRDDLAPFLYPYLGDVMAEGVGWKLAPLRIFPNHYELSLDNDCILWHLPEAIGEWLGSHDRCLFAEDVV